MLPVTGYRVSASSCLCLHNIIIIIRGHATRPQRKVVDPFPLCNITAVRRDHHPHLAPTHAPSRTHATSATRTGDNNQQHTNTVVRYTVSTHLRHSRRHLAPTIPTSKPQFTIQCSRATALS